MKEWEDYKMDIKIEGLFWSLLAFDFIFIEDPLFINNKQDGSMQNGTQFMNWIIL